jgi:hypothetical protein
LFKYENDETNVSLKVYIDWGSFPDFEEKSFQKYKLQNRISSLLNRDISYYQQLEEYVVPGAPHTIAEVLSLENPKKKILIFYNNVEGEIGISLTDRRLIGTFDFLIHNNDVDNVTHNKRNIAFDFVPFLPFFQKRLETKSPMEDVDGGGRRITRHNKKTCKRRK